jgi:hypothetical protein
MEPYRNIEGNSEVTAYEIGPDYSTLEFSDGSAYRDKYASAGQEKVERMQGFAQAGRGLDTFIGTTVSKLYERKEK